MAKALIDKHKKALELRKKGMSYSQIKDILDVSKSSLGLWLQNLPLSEERIKELRDKNPIRIEKFRNTMRLKRENRLHNLYKLERSKLIPLSKRELLIGGLFLYWGEGAKTKPFETSLSNTNPQIIIYFIFWLTNIIGVPKEIIRIRLHLYSDMNEKQEKAYWAKQLNLPPNQFYKSYIKQTTLRAIKFKTFGHGTCNIRLGSRDITEKILTNIKIIADEYSYLC